MADQNQKQEPAPAPTKKAPYMPPTIRVEGRIEELTKGPGLGITDGIGNGGSII